MQPVRALLSTDTDLAWERLAQEDPYHAVLTDDPDRAEFFRSGERHVDELIGLVRQWVGDSWTPARILDFGCGVGRLVIPFARVAREVVGVDVSPTMLAEARRNCAELSSVRFVQSLDEVEGRFDLIHSFIVFQHVPVRRGMELIERLARLLAAGGVAAIHVTYGRRAPLYRRVTHRARATIPGVNALVNLVQGLPPATPLMQMNHYSVAAVSRLLGNSTVRAFETDHGGHLGVMLLGRRSL